MKSALQKVIARKKANNAAKVSKNNDLKLADYFGKKDHVTGFSLKDFRHMLLCPDAKGVRMPLSCQYATHLRTSRFRLTLQVNASGNALIVWQPNVAAALYSTSAYTTYLAINHVNYLPTGGNVAAAWVNVPNYDANFVNGNGMNIVSGEFQSASVVSAHVRYTLTGVSNLNKQGKVYIGESLSKNMFQGDGAEFATARILADTYSIPNLVKLKHFREAEIMNMDSSTAISYHYIPHASYSDIYTSEPANSQGTLPTNLVPDGVIQQAFLVNGAAAGTLINAEFTIHVEMRPSVAYLNTYPVEYSGCYDNPDPTMRKLRAVPEAVIRTCLTDTLKSAKLDGNFP